MSSAPNHPYVVLDVFTDTPLQGNQLAVFTEGEEVPSRLMQAAAREVNFSETVFLLPGDDGADAQVRIFTPAAELPFAGHPVLGAAFVVAEREGLRSVRLRTGAGIVPVHLRGAVEDDDTALSAGGDHPGADSPGIPLTYGEMEQPIPAIDPFPDAEALFAALGIDAAALPVDAYTNGPTHLMVGIPAETIAGLTPDMAALARVHGGGICVFGVTGPGQVKARVFCPGLGVDEDPATGSAAGPLALHLLRYGLHLWGSEASITQGIEIDRPSTLIVRVDGSGSVAGGDVEVDRIVVGGCAVRVAEGHFGLQ